MSLFSWLAPTKKPQPLPAPSSGLSRLESTKPFGAATQLGSAQPANRKHERISRRELLYAVVREAMVRAGVLSSSYKFKVLSLDPRGRQFMVMVDLARGAGDQTTRLAEIEAYIAQSAKHRHDILVSSVYWRSNEHVAVGEPPVRARPQPPVSRPAPLESSRPADSAPAPLYDPSQPAELHPEPPPPLRQHSYEPLHAEEVAAFKRALALGVAGREAVATVDRDGDPRASEKSYALLTGFEDTELVDNPETPERLSGTQYGDLR